MRVATPDKPLATMQPILHSSNASYNTCMHCRLTLPLLSKPQPARPPSTCPPATPKQRNSPNATVHNTSMTRAALYKGACRAKPASWQLAARRRHRVRRAQKPSRRATASPWRASSSKTIRDLSAMCNRSSLPYSLTFVLYRRYRRHLDFLVHAFGLAPDHDRNLGAVFLVP
jgi:hypothetical protein